LLPPSLSNAVLNNKKDINLYAKCMERKGETVVFEPPSGSNVTVGNESSTATQNDNVKTAILKNGVVGQYVGFYKIFVLTEFFSLCTFRKNIR
jgi:hypothetical protein